MKRDILMIVVLMSFMMMMAVWGAGRDERLCQNNHLRHGDAYCIVDY